MQPFSLTDFRITSHDNPRICLFIYLSSSFPVLFLQSPPLLPALPLAMSFNPPTGGASMHARSNLQTASGVRAFGLQLPKSKQTPTATAGAAKPVKAFSFSADDDDDAAESAPGPAQLAAIRAKKYAQQQARVLAEAPDAFSYDDVYEDRAPAAAPASRLGLSTAAAAAAAGRAPQPAVSAPSRYISALLSKSASRKLESDAVYERNLLKERSADDALHAGKEKFVTEGFKAQRAEQEAARRKQMEQDARDEAMERVRMKGGATAHLGLSLMASRNMLESRAGTAQSVAAAAESAAAPAAPAAAAPAPKRAAAAAELSAADDSSAAQEPSSKRSRLDSPAAAATTAGAAAMMDATPPAAAAAATAAAPASAASASPAAASAKVDAIAAVAAKLTTERATMSKKEEALAKLAARKAAAAGSGAQSSS